MLCRRVVITLVVASISTLRIGASEDREQRALPNETQTPIYGSSSEPSNTHNRTVIAPGGPGQQGVTYVRSEELQYQGQTNQNQNPSDDGGTFYGSYTRQKGNTYGIGPNDQSIFGSKTVQSGNTYETKPGSKNFFGSVTDQEGNRFIPRRNQQTSNNSSNSTAGQVHSQKPKKPDGQRRLSETELAALTVQDNNTGPNDRGIYGSFVQQETEVSESPNSSQPSSTHTPTVIAPGGPGQQGVSYVRSEERQYQGQTNQNQKPSDNGGTFYGSYTRQKGNTYEIGPNDQSIFGSKTVQSGNTYETKPGSKNFFGSVTDQEGNRFIPRRNQQTSNNSSNSTAGQVHSQKPKKPDGQRRLSETELAALERQYQGQTNQNQKPSDGGGTFFENRYTSHQTHSQKLKKPNGQTRLSSDNSILFLFSWILLSKYYLF